MKLFKSTIYALLFLSAGSRADERPVGVAVEADEYWGLRHETGIKEAVTVFNKANDATLKSVGASPLRAQEVLMALSLGSSGYLSGNEALWKDACVDYFQKEILPQGAKLYLVTETSIGPPGKEKEFKLTYIYLMFGIEPENGKWNYIQKPSAQWANRMATVPVRLALGVHQ